MFWVPCSRGSSPVAGDPVRLAASRRQILSLPLHPSETVDFVIAAIALIPLAWLIGEATEHAAHHTGPGIGGFLNATFGNAPELIIALFAVADAKFEVVRGSLSGSVVGNLLLVLGFSLIFGGRGALDRESSFVSLGLSASPSLLFLIPAIPGLRGRPRTALDRVLSLIPAVLLLVVYVVVTWSGASPAPSAPHLRRAQRDARLVAADLARRARRRRPS